MTAEEVIAYIADDVEFPTLILNHNLHSAYLVKKMEWFRGFYGRASRIVIDGFPILALAGLGRASSFRIGSTDWLSRLGEVQVERLERPYKVYVFGGSEDINLRAQMALRQQWDGLEVDGHHGYLTPAAIAGDVLRHIREFEPQLVLVGLGMPRQEQFILDHIDNLPPAHYATVGGAIDYLAGAVPLAPRWLGGIGLEWLWRLLHDPRRLARRYMIEPFALARIIIFGR